ncbi:MAG: mechanosensitive ion channel [Candidatus Accumulibacter sp.]|uniref:mechanosensitive ion channel family protein n=1 Tax=Accumulibacter sp. TaxID=2053492 RepID=UPI0025EAD59B|nr:mechanosensitive ion channel domain-containing protein [Accumulibacter sp.]MCP5247144.1 mechanosensitive ion channel [Accumulibacter sp.]
MTSARPFSKRVAALASLSFFLLASCLLLSGAAWATPPIEQVPTGEAVLYHNFRPIVTFRGTVLGASPAVRARRSADRIDNLTPSQMLLPIELTPLTLDGVRGITVTAGGNLLFGVTESDLDPQERLTLEQVAESAREKIAEALRADAAQRRPDVLLKGFGLAAVATVVAFALLWLISRATRLLVGRVQRLIGKEEAGNKLRWARHGWLLMQRVSQLFMGFLWLSVAYLWLTYVLARFPLTEPLGERLGDFLLDLIETIGTSFIGAIPSLTTVVVILFITKAANDAIGNFFRAAKAGRVHAPGLHADTVSATHRLVTVMVWGLGIAIAYPFIPMSNSDAFKGLSVMLGFMFTLGSAGIVNQLMSGLVLVYARALSVGDFVEIGDNAGVVSQVGVLSTKIINMRNEEITIPNAVLVGNPIRNFSRLAGERGTLVSTKVTIGYDTPWRQVHAMLIAAAQQTPGLRPVPTPFVYQKGLADWYVEYELFAHMDKPLDRIAVLSALHANIQDQFNTYGVQIMSPHFNAQPANNLVVPPDGWHAAPAAPEATRGKGK